MPLNDKPPSYGKMIFDLMASINQSYAAGMAAERAIRDAAANRAKPPVIDPIKRISEAAK